MRFNKLITSLLPLMLIVSACQQGEEPIVEQTLTFDIYVSNDFHGYVIEGSKNTGLGKFATYFKTKGEEPNTLLIDQGDSWQGSIYSNHNHGALVNDAMCIAQFDARTVGNHDFDWGIEALVANTSRSYNDYTIPVLAANVYDYNFDIKKEGIVQQSQIGQPSITYTLENGLKVGIVGVIGEDQITSITTSYVKDVCFKDHIKVLKEEATKLRGEGCQVIIASCHAGQGELIRNNLKEFVDVVLCGHTHRVESFTEGNLKYYQYGRNGENFGHVAVTYDKANNKVTSTGEILTASDIKKEVTAVDPSIKSLIDKYNSECDEEANQVVASDAEYFAKSSNAINLMCKAIYDRCVDEGYGDVILSYCNDARAYLPQGIWRYSDLYSAFPFDNIVYIAEVKGSDILYEVKNYNRAYFNPDFDYYVNPDQYYKIACLDYLLYHTDTSREFNYFTSFKNNPIGHLSTNYRDILKEWLIDNGYNEGEKLLASDFDSSLESFDTSKLH